MKRHTAAPLSRRSFIRRSLGAGAALGALTGPQILSFAQGDKTLRAGEATVDSTPPKGIELAGFHYPIGGKPRFITDIRQPSAVRARLKATSPRLRIAAIGVRNWCAASPPNRSRRRNAPA